MAAPRSLTMPLGVSALLHVGIVVALVTFRPPPLPPPPPAYRVELVAAPPGARSIGVVNPARVAPAQTRPPAQARRNPVPATTRRTPAGRQPVRATPAPPRAASAADRRAAQAVAGGGAVGGRGTDVANVKLDGPEFPFQAYLENIVRQIAMQFPREWAGALSAEVTFLIARDGSVRGPPRLAKRSGSFEFDAEALGAVDIVGRRRAFGPLPEGFAGDVLPVTFSFDPKIFR